MDADTITPGQLRALDAIRRANDQGFTGIGTGRIIRRAVMLKLKAEGLVRAEQMVVCDGDGFALDPERWRDPDRRWEAEAAGCREGEPMSTDVVEVLYTEEESGEQVTGTLRFHNASGGVSWQPSGVEQPAAFHFGAAELLAIAAVVLLRKRAHQPGGVDAPFSPGEALKLWPQAAGELVGFARVLERQAMEITAAQIRLALQLGGERYRQIGAAQISGDGRCTTAMPIRVTVGDRPTTPEERARRVLPDVRGEAALTVGMRPAEEAPTNPGLNAAEYQEHLARLEAKPALPRCELCGLAGVLDAAECPAAWTHGWERAPDGTRLPPKHGHVQPVPGKPVARCGGPSMCLSCAAEKAYVDGGAMGLRVHLEEQIRVKASLRRGGFTPRDPAAGPGRVGSAYFEEPPKR